MCCRGLCSKGNLAAVPLAAARTGRPTPSTTQPAAQPSTRAALAALAATSTPAPRADWGLRAPAELAIATWRPAAAGGGCAAP